MRSSEEKALRAIKRAESSRRLFRTLPDLMGKHHSPLTQVEVLSQPDNPLSPLSTITSKIDLERAILERNQRHSKQALKTPFMTIPFLQTAIDPFYLDNQLDNISNGNFVATLPDDVPLTHSQLEWISALSKQ